MDTTLHDKADKAAQIENPPIIAVAPMMDWTDRHCRFFHRLISPNARLYTEMVTTGALIHGDKERFLRFRDEEKPVVLQLGGDDPQALALSAKMGEDAGYNEINLNCGCPSDRVQSGNFGACLMAQPELVAECVASMRKAVSIPVTVKCRIGIDDSEDYEFLERFVDIVSQVGCTEFTIHARKAWLKGLSPKENREVPPLRYDIVEQIKAHYPHLTFILNGGVKSIDFITKNSKSYHGFMIGREAYQNPYFLSEIEDKLFQNKDIKTREEIALAMIPYMEGQISCYGTPVKTMTRHIIGLFHGQTGARQWRRYLSENAHKDNKNARVVEDALESMAISAQRKSA